MEQTAAGWRRALCLVVAALGLAVAMAAFTAPAASAATPNTCKAGYVWREAFPGDVVCVLWSSGSRDTVQAENRAAAGRTVPGQIWCLNGFVWREARPSDLVCVPPAARDRVRGENHNAVQTVADPLGVGRPFQPFIQSSRSGTQTTLYRYGTVGGASPNGTVSFWAIGRIPGQPAHLGSAVTNGSGGFDRALLSAGLCGTEPWRSYPVVALDVRTGRLAYANDTWVYGC
jgi:hypothetical protein